MQEGVDHLRRVRNLHLQFFARAETAFHELVDVVRGVDQHHVGFGGGLGCDEVEVVDQAEGEESLTNQAVFVGAKDMLADGEEVLFAIDELEGQHGPKVLGAAVKAANR